MKCWYCGVDLTVENDSKEHIIPNALGGQLVSKGLLCKIHNQLLGHSIDSELSKQLKPLIDLINPIKDRPYTDFIEGTNELGEPYTIASGFKGIFKINITLPDGKEFAIRAKTKDEADKAIARKKKEIEAKFPGSIMGKVNYVEEKPRTIFVTNQKDKPYSLFEGKAFSRAVLKIILNFYLWRGGDIKYMSVIISLIKDEKKFGFLNHIRFYYTSLPFHLLNDDEISHLLYIKGDGEGNLIAYVEFLSCVNLFIVIDTNYIGPVFFYQYCYDLVSSKEIHKEITINKPKDFYERFSQFALPDNKWVGDELYKRFIKVAEKNQNIFYNR